MLFNISRRKIFCTTVLRSFKYLLKWDSVQNKCDSLAVLVRLIQHTYCAANEFQILSTSTGSNFKSVWLHQTYQDFFEACFDDLNDLVQTSISNYMQINSFFVCYLYDLSIFLIETVSIRKLMLKRFLQVSLCMLDKHCDLSPTKYENLVELILYKLQMEQMEIKSMIYANEIMNVGFGSDVMAKLKTTICSMIDSSHLSDVKRVKRLFAMLQALGNIMSECLSNISFLMNIDFCKRAHSIVCESISFIKTWILNKLLKMNGRVTAQNVDLFFLPFQLIQSFIRTPFNALNSITGDYDKIILMIVESFDHFARLDPQSDALISSRHVKWLLFKCIETLIEHKSRVLQFFFDLLRLF